jgi:hypothetical protein
MSELCRGAGDSVAGGSTIHPSSLDLAGKYVLHLQYLHKKCSTLPNFRLDPNYGGLLPPLAIPPTLEVLGLSPHPQLTDPNQMRRLSQTAQSPRNHGNSCSQMYSTSAATGCAITTQSPTSAISPRTHYQGRRPTGLSPTWYTSVSGTEDRGAGPQFVS